MASLRLSSASFLFSVSLVIEATISPTPTRGQGGISMAGGVGAIASSHPTSERFKIHSIDCIDWKWNKQTKKPFFVFPFFVFQMILHGSISCW